MQVPSNVSKISVQIAKFNWYEPYHMYTLVYTLSLDITQLDSLNFK